ncbi:MAG: DUF3726 domain-containing protein [Hellea sp.]|nr:DUF3726 domain-containing protein [Hellea sp.]
MAETITISINEFRALLRKAFEGLYVHEQDYNQLARLVIWLECRKLSGIKMFLEAEDGPGSRWDLNLNELDSGEYFIEANGMSLLCFNDLACDLAIGRAKNSGMSIVHISGAMHPEVIAASVARCVRNGLSACAWWPDEDVEVANLASQEAGQAEPMMCRVDLPKSYGGHIENVTLVCAEKLSDLESKYRHWFSYKDEDYIASDMLSSTFTQSLDNGLTLSMESYKRLCHCADRVLVEATEASRRGAGA